MIKKILIIILIINFITACGKKGDPEYKEKTSKTNIKSYII